MSISPIQGAAIGTLASLGTAIASKAISGDGKQAIVNSAPAGMAAGIAVVLLTKGRTGPDAMLATAASGTGVTALLAAGSHISES